MQKRSFTIKQALSQEHIMSNINLYCINICTTFIFFALEIEGNHITLICGIFIYSPGKQREAAVNVESGAALNLSGSFFRSVLTCASHERNIIPLNYDIVIKQDRLTIIRDVALRTVTAICLL
jgi:hypothetical protein